MLKMVSKNDALNEVKSYKANLKRYAEYYHEKDLSVYDWTPYDDFRFNELWDAFDGNFINVSDCSWTDSCHFYFKTADYLIDFYGGNYSNDIWSGMTITSNEPKVLDEHSALYVTIYDDGDCLCWGTPNY